MGNLFGSALKAVGGLFSNMFGGAAKGATGAATKSGGGLIDGLLGKKPMNLPYSPTKPYSPTANGSTAMPSMQGEQQVSGENSIMKDLGAAMGHSVGQSGNTGRQRAEAMAQVSPEMLGQSHPQNPMSMLAAMQQYQQPQQQQRQFAENPWLQYFMQNMGGGR